jgi:hypothetical protein
MALILGEAKKHTPDDSLKKVMRPPFSCAVPRRLCLLVYALQQDAELARRESQIEEGKK